MRETDKRHGYSPSVEAHVAVAASPGPHSRYTEQEVRYPTPMGTPTGLTEAPGTNHFERSSMGSTTENIGLAQFLRNTFPLGCTVAKCFPFSLSEATPRPESEISP